MNTTQNKKWYQIWWVWLIILAVIGQISKCNNCGCSNSDIVSLQKNLGISYKAAKELCCEMNN